MNHSNYETAMSSDTNSERRLFARIDDTLFFSFVLPGKKPREVKAITSNISQTGLMFEIDCRVPVNELLEIQLYQPINSFKTMIYVMPITARVVWENKIRNGFFEVGENQYRVGLNFCAIRQEDVCRIGKYVTSHSQK